VVRRVVLGHAVRLTSWSASEGKRACESPAIQSDVDDDGRAGFSRSLEFCGRLPEQAACDDQLLDLLRPPEDVHDSATGSTRPADRS